MSEALDHHDERGDDRAGFLKMLERYYREEVPLLNTMLGSLPEEIIINIFGFVANNNTTTDVLHLRSQHDVHLTSAQILSNQIFEAAPYRLLLQRTVLEILPIRLDVTFTESGEPDVHGIAVVAKLPDFSAAVLPDIRTLVMRLERKQVTSTRRDRSLVIATCGMASLSSQLSRYTLHKLITEIGFSGPKTRNNGIRDTLGMSSIELMLDHRYSFVTPTERGRNRIACEHLVEVLRELKMARTLSIKIHALYPDESHEDVGGLKVEKTVIASARSAAEIVEHAIRISSRSC